MKSDEVVTGANIPEVVTGARMKLPWWQKYTLILNEASEYWGIGYKKLSVLSRNMWMRISSCGMGTVLRLRGSGSKSIWMSR